MKLTQAIATVQREFGKFGVIGLIGFIIDVAMFNFLRFHQEFGFLEDRPITAKVLSTVTATTWTYFGNRLWTYKHRQRTSFRREYALFVILSAIGMLIAVTCLWISHYVLKFDSPLADNISANFVGLILGTLFRFWSYRRWVFLEHPERPAEHPHFSAIIP